MKDTVLGLFEAAFYYWSVGVAEVWDMLSMSPEAFADGALWNTATAVNTALEGVGLGLLVLFFMISLVKSAMSIKDFMRPETLFRFIAQIAISKAVISYGMTIITSVFSLGSFLVTRVTGSLGMTSALLTVPPDIVSAINDTPFMGQFGLMAVVLIGSLALVASMLIIKLKVYGRFFTIAMFTALSPLPLAGIAGSETVFMTKAFLRGLCSIALEGAIIMLAFALWLGLINLGGIGIISASTPFMLVVSYMLEVLFSAMLLVMTIMTSDKLAHKIMGL